MSKRILVVDDSPIILAAARVALVDAGFDVETRLGVDELGEKGAHGFDLVLMDVQMPELYGDDVASVLRGQRALTTPIYLFSTLPEHELRELALQANKAISARTPAPSISLPRYVASSGCSYNSRSRWTSRPSAASTSTTSHVAGADSMTKRRTIAM
jgi:CheY-like chemotaxis protein